MKLVVCIGAIALLAGCRGPIRGRVPVPQPQVHGDPGPIPLPPHPDPVVISKSPEIEAAVSGTDSPSVTPKPDPAAVIADINGRLADIFFEFDRSDLGREALAVVDHDAKLLAPILSDFPRVTVWIEGHCDERGSAEYNIALGNNRAARVADVFRTLRLDAARLRILSYGRERPQCTESSESCWQRNRRAHIVLRADDVTN